MNVSPPDETKLRFPQKFYGEKAHLFATGCAHYSDEAERDCNVNSDEHPLYVRLSLNQRLKLISEVAVGLLCPREPLPPETIEHYSAFLGIIACIRTELEIEMDDVDSDIVGDDLLEKYYEGKPQRNRRTDEEAAEWGNELALLEKIGRKNKRMLERSQRTENSDDEVEYQVDNTIDLATFVQEHNQKLALLFSGGPCSDREPSRPLTTEEKYYAFRWRLLCDAAFQEDSTPGFITPPLSHVNFCWHCFEEKKWYKALNLLFLDYPSVSREDDSLVWGAIGAATYADPNEHARIRKLNRVVKELRESYEANWDASRKAEDQRLIFAVCEVGSYCGTGHRPFVLEFISQCQARGFELDTKGKYQERLDIYRSIQGEFADGLDKGFFHGRDSSMNPSFDDPKCYEFEDLMNVKNCHNPRHYHNLISDETDPTAPEPSLTTKLMKCAGCKVVYYCSKRC